MAGVEITYLPRLSRLDNQRHSIQQVEDPLVLLLHCEVSELGCFLLNFYENSKDMSQEGVLLRFIGNHTSSS
jgi:hypothetical protein